MLVGSILVGTAIFNQTAQAHGCADGDSFIGLWTSPAGNVASRTTSTGPFYGASHFQFSWRLTVQPGEGHAYSADLVGRCVFQNGTMSGWYTDITPTKVPTVDYFLWACQVQATSDAPTSCKLDCLLTSYAWLEDEISGYGYDVELEWLRADADGDTVPNLYDPDVFLECPGSIFEEGGCTRVSGLEDAGDGLGLVEPTDIADAPYTGGDMATGYACGSGFADTARFGGSDGAPMPASSQSAAYMQTWRLQYWKNGNFGLPDHAKPYEGAYNMLRAGQGGGESAYFSACWGKTLEFIPYGTNAFTGIGFLSKRTTAYFWHRYVVIGTVWIFQVWDPGASCWVNIGVEIRTSAVTSEPGAFLGYSTGTGLRPYVTTNYRDMIPNGYMPGDVIGDTLSNVENGLYSVPSGFTGTTDSVIYGTPFIGGRSFSGPSLTASDIERAFGNALRAAGVGGSGSGGGGDGLTGEGGTEAAVGVFGMSGVGDGGVSTGIEEGMAEAESDLGELAGLTLGLDTIEPAANVEGVFNLALPVPGFGAYNVELSTLPDTTQPWGVALEGFRLLIRLGIATWWSIVLTLKLIGIYRELT